MKVMSNNDSHMAALYYTTSDLAMDCLHMSTNSTHLLITHGTAILFNQDIHPIKVPTNGCQHNRCLTLLQGVETFTVGDGGMQLKTDHYICNT